MQVTKEDITFVAKLVDELCGVILDDTKGYLIESRLGELAKASGCASYRDLCQKARLTHNQVLQNQIIDAITTQETLFFRDESPFAALQYKAIPELLDSKAKTAFPKRIRIWSAASSTGQEAYSTAMMLCETIPDVLSWDIHILATDISDAAIKVASQGWYAKHEIQRGMKPQLLTKYFVEQQGGWKIKDSIRAMVQFQKRNLHQPFLGIGPFDIIFCRNVAIYFDVPRRRDLFLRLSERLTPDGYLLVGSSESLLDLGPRFAPQSHCRATYYQPNRPLRAEAPLARCAAGGR
ncbi:MAG: protein-glutamate O-methyltransferase CheR [Planctomycetota bacterium]